jgi:hypothetical protein
MLTRLLAFALVLFGCSAPGESCGFEDGVYTVRYRVLNGDCPDIPLKVASPAAISPECKQTFRYQHNCGVNVVRECVFDGKYGRTVLDLEPQGADYFGLLQVDTPSCSGLYDVTYTAQ